MSIKYTKTDGTIDESFVGAVIARGEHNHYHDSYFYAVVWDDEAGRTREVETHSTAYGGPWPSVTIDATPEVLAKVDQYRREQWVYSSVLNADRARHTPIVGDRVRSTTTRGKNKGVQGIVGHVAADTYSRDESAQRLRVQLDDGEQRWLSGSRVEIIDPRPIDYNAILRIALH